MSAMNRPLARSHRALAYLLLSASAACAETSPADPAAGESDAALSSESAAQLGAEHSASGDDRAADVGDELMVASQLLSAYVEQDPTLVLDGDACTNASAIAARLRAVTSGCASVTGQACAPGALTATMDVDFTDCAVGAATVSGHTEATVTVDAQPSVALAITLDPIALTSAGVTHQLSGSLETSTTNLSEYTLSADLTTDVHSVSFSGTAHASESAGGALLAVTLDGEGAIDGGGSVIEVGDITCTGGSIQFRVVGLHRDLALCHGDAGTITTQEGYACTTKPTVTRSGKALGDGKLTASAEDVFTWSATTPATNLVHEVSTFTIEDRAIVSESDVTLPACE